MEKETLKARNDRADTAESLAALARCRWSRRPSNGVRQSSGGGNLHLARRLHPAPQEFRHAPRLRDAAAGRVGRLGVENLADGAEAGLAQMRDEAIEKVSRGSRVVRVQLHPSVDIGADQPSPDGALMIGSVAGAEVAEIFWLVIGVAGGKRAEP